MYSIFCSKFDKVFEKLKDDLKIIIKPNMKVVIFPWTFPVELNSEKIMNDFFKKGERRYNKYIPKLLELGISAKNILIADCYGMDSKKIKSLIKSSDILLFIGGNPEMLFNKVVHKSECLYDIKHYKGIIIGESAGALLQQERYFITAKNNFYKYFAFYDGFGVIDDPFYIDVHSINNKLYKDKLRNVSKITNKSIYMIYDDGAIIYNRENKNIKEIGRVEVIKN